MQEVERSAPSVEEALEAALAELGVSEQEVDVLIVQEPKGGFLGMGGQDAVVRVRLRAHGTELSEDVMEEQGEVAADFLEGLLERMGVSAGIEPDLQDDTMYVDILGEGPDDEDMGLLIGHHGQTLDALQELTRIVVSHRTGERCRVIVDVEDYRKRRRSRLASRVREIADRVARTGREEELEPMTPYERKIVHDAVARVSGVETLSKGEDPERRVVIRPRAS
ncbi:MAG TPA: RNA-binding cell elongation regulator Jag/EloR [Actinomycetota bacterium]